MTKDSLCGSMGENSVDLALMIFVLSAISPEKMVSTLKNVFQVRICHVDTWVTAFGKEIDLRTLYTVMVGSDKPAIPGQLAHD